MNITLHYKHSDKKYISINAYFIWNFLNVLIEENTLLVNFKKETRNFPDDRRNSEKFNALSVSWIQLLLL